VIGDRRPATGGGEDAGNTAHAVVPDGIIVPEVWSSGSSTAQCHAVRGYRFDRPPVSGSGCPVIRPGACPGGDKPGRKCRIALGYVTAQTTLRTDPCDHRWSRRPTAPAGTTLNEEERPPRPPEGW
jgi:hypothetical protein